MLTMGAYGLGLLVTVLSGGSALPLKLHSAAETGVLGLACLVSVALRRPLLLLGLRILAHRRGRSNGAWRKVFAEPVLGRTFSVITVIVGVGLLIEATSQAALALVLPTVVFVAVSLPVRFAIYGGGAGLFLALRGRGVQPVGTALAAPRKRRARGPLLRPREVAKPLRGGASKRGVPGGEGPLRQTNRPLRDWGTPTGRTHRSPGGGSPRIRSATSSWLPTKAVPAPPRTNPMPAHRFGATSRRAVDPS